MLRIVSLLVLALAIWRFQIRVGEEDREGLTKIVQESIDLRSKSPLELSPIRQWGKQVHKHLWVQKQGSWENLTITSDTAELLLSQDKQKIKAIEHLSVIQGSSSKGTVLADLGTFDLRTSTLYLQGTVQMRWPLDGVDTFALADRAIVQLDQKTMVLESNPSHRVLFWQEGLELSAPLIHVHKEVRAIGDVHLAFDSKEKQYIERLWTR